MLKTLLLLLPVLILAGLAFWFIFPAKSKPVLISDQTSSKQDLSTLTGKINALENKVTELESSNSGLLNKLNSLESAGKGNPVQSANKSSVLLPINPGGSVNSTSWQNLTSGTVTVDPADYPGYKSAYLKINLSVFQGQGTAYARLVNTANTLAIIPSQVSTGSFSAVALTSAGFKLPAGANTYTIQLYTQVPGYPAQAADSFLQITY